MVGILKTNQVDATRRLLTADASIGEAEAALLAAQLAASCGCNSLVIEGGRSYIRSCHQQSQPFV